MIAAYKYIQGGKHTEKKELFKLKENTGMRTNGYKLVLNM